MKDQANQKRYRALIPVANGNEDLEVIAMIDVLRRAGFYPNSQPNEQPRYLYTCHNTSTAQAVTGTTRAAQTELDVPRSVIKPMDTFNTTAPTKPKNAAGKHSRPSVYCDPR